MKIDIDNKELANIINGSVYLNGNFVEGDTTESILNYIDECGAEMSYKDVIRFIQYDCTVYSDEGAGCTIDDFINDCGYFLDVNTYSEHLEELIEAVNDRQPVIISENAIIMMK